MLMNLQLEITPIRETIRETIRGFIEINQDILNSQYLSNEQRRDLVKLENELSNLGYESNESKIKIELIDIFNRLN
jgi:hypothetical protein